MICCPFLWLFCIIHGALRYHSFTIYVLLRRMGWRCCLSLLIRRFGYHYLGWKSVENIRDFCLGYLDWACLCLFHSFYCTRLFWFSVVMSCAFVLLRLYWRSRERSRLCLVSCCIVLAFLTLIWFLPFMGCFTNWSAHGWWIILL